MKSADNVLLYQKQENAIHCTEDKKKGHINAYMFALCPIQDQEDILRPNKSASSMCMKYTCTYLLATIPKYLGVFVRV